MTQSHFPHHHRRADDDPCPQPTAPMTAEQLEWFTAESERLANKTLWKYSKRAMLGFALLFIGFLFNAQNNARQWDRIEDASTAGRTAIVQSGRVVSVDGCNRAYEERVKIRDVFLNSQRIVRARLAKGNSPNPKADRQALRFYAEQLKIFKLPDCRAAEKLLTDDPDAPVRDVDPWYPGNPNAPQSVFAQPPPRSG